MNRKGVIFEIGMIIITLVVLIAAFTIVKQNMLEKEYGVNSLVLFENYHQAELDNYALQLEADRVLKTLIADSVKSMGFSYSSCGLDNGVQVWFSRSNLSCGPKKNYDELKRIESKLNKELKVPYLVLSFLSKKTVGSAKNFEVSALQDKSGGVFGKYSYLPSFVSEESIFFEPLVRAKDDFVACSKKPVVNQLSCVFPDFVKNPASCKYDDLCVVESEWRGNVYKFALDFRGSSTKSQFKGVKTKQNNIKWFGLESSPIEIKGDDFILYKSKHVYDERYLVTHLLKIKNGLFYGLSGKISNFFLFQKDGKIGWVGNREGYFVIYVNPDNFRLINDVKIENGQWFVMKIKTPGRYSSSAVENVQLGKRVGDRVVFAQDVSGLPQYNPFMSFKGDVLIVDDNHLSKSFNELVDKREVLVLGYGDPPGFWGVSN